MASGPSSIVAGFAMYGILHWLTGFHRDADDRIVGTRITACILLSITLYSIIVCLTGQWALSIPVSTSIRDGFKDERASWLLFGLMLDVAVRLYMLVGNRE